MRTNAAVLWNSKALKIVADSTTEAETAQGSRASKDSMFTKAVLRGIKRPALGPMPMTGDNKAMHELIDKDGASHRTRYFERATMFVKWAVLKLLVKLYLVRSEDCVADIFTKAVDKTVFMKLRSVLFNMGSNGDVSSAVAHARRLANALGRLSGRAPSL